MVRVFYIYGQVVFDTLQHGNYLFKRPFLLMETRLILTNRELQTACLPLGRGDLFIGSVVMAVLAVKVLVQVEFLQRFACLAADSTQIPRFLLMVSLMRSVVAL